MRKLLIIAVLVLGMSITALAQDVYHASSTSVGTWNNASKKWIWGKVQETDLKIISQSNVLLINNKSQTALRLNEKTLEENVNGIQQTGWSAVDQNNTTCFVKVAKSNSTGKREIYIMYSNYAFLYYLD